MEKLCYFFGKDVLCIVAKFINTLIQEFLTSELQKIKFVPADD